MRDISIGAKATEVTLGRRRNYTINPHELVQEAGSQPVEDDIRSRRTPERFEDHTEAEILQSLVVFGGLHSLENHAPNNSLEAQCAALIFAYLANYLKRDPWVPKYLSRVMSSSFIAQRRFEQVREGVERCFLAFDEYHSQLHFAELVTRMDERDCKRKLDWYAEHMYGECDRAVNDLQEFTDRARDVAANTMLYMLQGVMLRQDLYVESMEDEAEKFWGVIFKAFTLLIDRMTQEQCEVLRGLYHLIVRNPNLRTQREALVHAFDALSR